ncbi:MAG: thrombospondin type-1 domain-containing protein [Pseudomonadota bacterium]
MKSLPRVLLLLAAVCTGPVIAATTATTTPGTWTLYRGTAIVGSNLASQDACVAAARARNVTSSYSCRTSTTVSVVYTADTRVNCVVSAWGAWTAGPAGFETRTRTIVTPAANGGTACPALSEQRAVTVTPPSGGPSISLNPATYAAGGYSTISWKGTAPCTASAAPSYSAWSGSKQADWSQSVAPTASTVFTITCANGAKSVSLTVTGGTSGNPPSGGGGGSTPGTPPVENLPPVSALPSPISRVLVPISTSNSMDSGLLSYSHTANREWNYEGHVVAANFPEDQGNWSTSMPSTYHAWLFDRPSSWFKLYQLTNDPNHLAYAIRDTAYYASQINAGGYFIPKANAGEEDTKYGYVTPFLLYERATGNNQYRAVAQRVYQASLTGFSSTYSTSEALWTEREAGLHGEAALAYYELTGEQAALNRAGAIIRQVGTLAAAHGGAPQVSYTQHEGGGPGGTEPTSLTNSPWMTAFYFQFARRYYEITGDTQVLTQVSNYFDWLTVNGLYDGSKFHPEFAGVTVPRYLTGELIGDAGYDEGNIQHCLDVAGLVSFAVDAKRKLGLPTAVAQQRLTELKSCSVRAFANWTRDTNYLPKYRIQSPRMWMWWMRGRYELAP